MKFVLRIQKAPLRWVEKSLWALGFFCLGWVGVTWTEARLFQIRAADELERAGAGSVATASQTLPAGTPIARLRIPRLELAAVVAEDTSPTVLEVAIGHWRGSALPGEDGNIVLAGHRDSFFRPLERVEVGDRVVLETFPGRRVYIVEWTRIVEPSEVAVGADAGYPALTLITCYPFRYVGSAPRRFVVRARLAEQVETQIADAGAGARSAVQP